MTTDMSLSDIAAVTRENDGDWGNGSWLWFIALVLFAMRGSFGGTAGGEAVTEAGLCNAMNFNNLENAVGRLSDQNQNQTAQVEASIASMAKENALGQANLASQLADCCCTTQRGIDSVNFNAATNTASINATTVEQTQKILDAISQNKIDALQAKISELEMANAMQGVVRYPNGFTFNAGANPFCGSGSCCGTSF